MNIRFKRRLNTVFACGTVIVVGLLVACEPPVQPQPIVNTTVPQVVAPRITIIPELAEGEEDHYPAQVLSIETDTPDVDIYYTIDGSTPDRSSRLYGFPFRLGELGRIGEMTVKAMATKEGFTPSDMVSTDLRVQPPTVSLSVEEGDVVLNTDSLTISAIRAEIIYYAVSASGTVPDLTASRIEYDGNNKPTFASLVDAILGDYPKVVTISAIASSAGVDSGVVSVTFTVSDVLLMPVFVFSPTPVTTESTMTIRSTTGSTIYYTTQGSDPVPPVDTSTSPTPPDHGVRRSSEP